MRYIAFRGIYNENIDVLAGNGRSWRNTCKQRVKRREMGFAVNVVCERSMEKYINVQFFWTYRTIFTKQEQCSV